MIRRTPKGHPGPKAGSSRLKTGIFWSKGSGRFLVIPAMSKASHSIGFGHQQQVKLKSSVGAVLTSCDWADAHPGAVELELTCLCS